MKRIPGNVPLYLDGDPVAGTVTLVLRAGEANEVAFPPLSCVQMSALVAMATIEVDLVSRGTE